VSLGLARLGQRSAGKPGRAWRWTWVVSGVFAACVPLVAWPVTREFTRRCVSACVQESDRVRRYLLGNSGTLSASSTYVRPEQRKTAPDFELNDSSGNPVRLSSFRGRVVLLNFWATWCAPCRKEIPWFIEFQGTWRNRGFTVLGIALDEDGWNAVRPYVEANRVDYRVMLGNDEVLRAYGGLENLPTTLIIDKNGRIAALHTGVCNRNEYEADIRAALNEQ